MKRLSIRWRGEPAPRQLPQATGDWCTGRAPDGWFSRIAAVGGGRGGVGAAALVTLVKWLQEFFVAIRHRPGPCLDLPHSPHRLSLAWLLAKRLAHEVAGDGVPQAVAAIEVQGGRMRARAMPPEDPGHRGDRGWRRFGRAGGSDRPDRRRHRIVRLETFQPGRGSDPFLGGRWRRRRDRRNVSMPPSPGCSSPSR